jgi:hypothetical protein
MRQTTVAGLSSAHGMLDAMRAAFRLPGAGLSAAARVAVWGVTTQQRLYVADHVLADNQAVGDVVSWLTDRFAGRPTSGDC